MTDDPRNRVQRLLMGAVLAWGAVVALGAYLFRPELRRTQPTGAAGAAARAAADSAEQPRSPDAARRAPRDIRKPLVVLAVFGGFVALWLAAWHGSASRRPPAAREASSNALPASNAAAKTDAAATSRPPVS